MFAFGLGVIFLLAFLVGSLFWFRKRRRPMRSLEESAATTWLSFRRIVALGAALMLTMGVMRNIYLFFDLHDFRYALYALLGAGLAFTAYFFGRYGKVDKRSTAKQDIDAHDRRIRKYGWRW